MNQSTLEAKGFIATDADIETLSGSILSSATEIESGRRNYLRTLIATTQDKLGAKPRMRQGKPAKLEREATQAQLTALTDVHDRFYAIVSRVAAETVPNGTKDRGIEINRRTNFARTSLYAVRRWVRAGNDLTALGVKSVTKASLAVDGERVRPQSETRLKSKVERERTLLIAALDALAEVSKESAAGELQAAMDQITERMISLGLSKPTRDVTEAQRDNLPLRMKNTIFMPTSRPQPVVPTKH